MEALKNKKGYLCDMDGVMYKGKQMIEGADTFLKWLEDNDKRFLFLTNSSEFTRKELKDKLQTMGINISEDSIYTSAMATAEFISSQCPQARAYVIGGKGLNEALYEQGIRFDDKSPDYVVVGETSNYHISLLTKAIRLVNNGANLIGTNYDAADPSEDGLVPACGALVAPIEIATGKKPYYIGKPNPLMMRSGLKLIDIESKNVAIIGDRMDTDIIAGIESGIDTVLVLSGVTSEKDILKFPFKPRLILNSIKDIVS